MADVAFGSVGKIIDVACKIKEAAETVRQNSKECRLIQRCVAHVTCLIKRLDEVLTETLMSDEVVREALEDLAESHEGALQLVTKCQRKHVLGRFLGVAGMAKELRKVQDDILRHLDSAGLEKLPYGDVPFVDASGRFEKEEVATGSGMPSDSSYGLTKFSLFELEAATHSFSKKNIVGQGFFGVVFKGVLCNGLVVAVKEFYRAITENDIMPDISICVKLQHKNVVKTLGYCVRYEEVSILQRGIIPVKEMMSRGMVVTEYLPNGNLAKKIMRGKKRGICWSSCFQIIQGIAQGLHYLHELNILHLDLKPENILFDSDMNPVIVDLGLSRALKQHYLYILATEGPLGGTTGYMPREYIQDGIMSKKFDVFSFGIILLETISSGCTKNRRYRGPHEWDDILEEGGRGQMKELFDRKLVEESQIMDIERCLKIGLLCTATYMEDRPTIAEVLEMLNGKKRLPIRPE